MINVLYIHGMGGGGDSRIPSILNDSLNGYGVDVIVRTYDFNPDTAAARISEWVDELEPSLIIGESLGSLHAMRIKGLPHLYVSPALNAPLYFSFMAWLTFIPGVTSLLDHIYKPKDGDRQKLHFVFDTLRKYKAHRRAAFEAFSETRGNDLHHAFFGKKDHYRRTGVVSIRAWEKHFGQTYSLYEGTHFMEEEFIYSMLVPAVLKVLKIK